MISNTWHGRGCDLVQPALTGNQRSEHFTKALGAFGMSGVRALRADGAWARAYRMGVTAKKLLK